MSYLRAPATPTTPSGSDGSSQSTPAKRRSRKQDIAREVNPDSQFQVQISSSSGGELLAVPLQQLPGALNMQQLQQRANGSPGNAAASATGGGGGGGVPGARPRLKQDRRSSQGRVSRKRKSLPHDSDGEASDDAGGPDEVAAGTSQAKDSHILLEKDILHRCSGDPVTYGPVSINRNFGKLREHYDVVADPGRSQLLTEQQQHEWIADQPPVIDNGLVGKTYLARIRPFCEQLYRVAEVVTVGDGGTVNVRFLNADPNGSMVVAKLPGKLLRIYTPIPLIELRMILTAKFRRQGAAEGDDSGVAYGDGEDDGDDEVAHITERALHAQNPIRAGGQLTPDTGGALIYSRDRETRTPNRIYRTSSTRTPGAFIPDAAEQFMKGDLLCLGNSSRKRYNGSQWRSLCTHASGCDRESQRGGSCSMHGQKESGRKSTGGTEYPQYPTPISVSNALSQQCTPSKEFTQPVSDHEAAHSLLALASTGGGGGSSSAGKEPTAGSVASGSFVGAGDASPMTGTAKPVHFPSSVSPPSGAAQPSVTVGAPNSMVTGGNVIQVMSKDGRHAQMMFPCAPVAPPVMYSPHPGTHLYMTDPAGLRQRTTPQYVLVQGPQGMAGLQAAAPNGLLPQSYLPFPTMNAQPAAMPYGGPIMAAGYQPRKPCDGIASTTGGGGGGGVENLPPPFPSSSGIAPGIVQGYTPGQFASSMAASAAQAASISGAGKVSVPFYRSGISTTRDPGVPSQPAVSSPNPLPGPGAGSASSSSHTPPATPDGLKAGKATAENSLEQQQQQQQQQQHQQFMPVVGLPAMRGARRTLFGGVGGGVGDAHVAVVSGMLHVVDPSNPSNPSPSSQLGDVPPSVAGCDSAAGVGGDCKTGVRAADASAFMAAASSGITAGPGMDSSTMLQQHYNQQQERSTDDGAANASSSFPEMQPQQTKTCRSTFPDRSHWCENCVAKKNGCSKYKSPRNRGRRGKVAVTSGCQ